MLHNFVEELHNSHFCWRTRSINRCFTQLGTNEWSKMKIMAITINSIKDYSQWKFSLYLSTFAVLKTYNHEKYFIDFTITCYFVFGIFPEKRDVV